MELTYLGHQGWCFSEVDSHLLVDPILTDSFGSSPWLRFTVSPKRLIDCEGMPRPVAVVITNEHLDHMHLPSLKLLPVDVPVLVHSLTSAVAVEAITQLGLAVTRAQEGETHQFGDLSVQLYRGWDDAPFWENRVSQAHVFPSDDRSAGAYIQSDTLVNPSGRAVLDCSPTFFIATHNAQVPPPGFRGALDNLLPLDDERATQALGLDLIHDLLETYPRLMPSTRCVVLSGGGYRQVPEKHGPFRWADFAALETIARTLALGVDVVGPRPGESFSLEDGRLRRGNVPWVTCYSSESPMTDDRGCGSAPDMPEIAYELPPVNVAGDEAVASAVIEGELPRLARTILVSELGRDLLRANEYLGQGLGPHRFVLHLRTRDGAAQAQALNVNRARFELLAGDLRSLIYAVPFGIDCNLVDLADVIGGRLQIWELATARMNQWYVTDRFRSPVAFLYAYFSEQCRPDIAQLLYQHVAETNDL